MKHAAFVTQLVGAMLLTFLIAHMIDRTVAGITACRVHLAPACPQ